MAGEKVTRTQIRSYQSQKETKMKPLRSISAVMIVGICALASSTTYAADAKDTARAKALQTQKAVVTIRLVSKMKISLMGQNQDQESKIEVVGTVIDPDGLTVTDLSSLDPTYMLQSIVGLLGGAGMKLDSEVKETAILLEDGTEVAAEVVLKDSDLGLAFIRPLDASHKFDAVTLKNRSVQPQLLDSIFTVGRLGKYSNRALTLTFDSIRAISKGPRSFYVGEKETQAFLGCIAYSSEGEPVGVYVMKQKQSGSDVEGGSGAQALSLLANLGAAKDALLPIIRPINDVIEVAQQAKKVKTPEKQGSAQEQSR
jgi:hypothetical protein